VTRLGDEGLIMPKKLLLCVLFLVSLPLQAAGERLLFWHVATVRAEVWLLGSMHLARADIYPLREEITQAFAAADALVVEVDIGGVNQMAIQELMLSRGTYRGNETIRDHLSATTWQALQERLRQSGLHPALMERMKPGLVVTTLTTVEMMKLGLNPELGIDRHFLDQARAQKNILELETIDQQLDLLLNFPDADLLVRQTLLEMDSLEETMEQLVSYWKSGDAEGLRRLVLDEELTRHPEFRPLTERMFDNRNLAMTDRIVSMQQRGGRYFIVVGAGHLLGDQGIIALLEKRGQKPRQL
jgi:uncharacterized protein YbaP (TraB family)